MSLVSSCGHNFSDRPYKSTVWSETHDWIPTEARARPPSFFCSFVLPFPPKPLHVGNFIALPLCSIPAEYIKFPRRLHLTTSHARCMTCPLTASSLFWSDGDQISKKTLFPCKSITLNVIFLFKFPILVSLSLKLRRKTKKTKTFQWTSRFLLFPTAQAEGCIWASAIFAPDAVARSDH